MDGTGDIDLTGWDLPCLNPAKTAWWPCPGFRRIGCLIHESLKALPNMALWQKENAADHDGVSSFTAVLPRSHEPMRYMADRNEKIA